MLGNYLPVVAALVGSLILSIAVTACGTNPAWLTATAESRESEMADAIRDSVIASVDHVIDTWIEATATSEAKLRWATTSARITATATFREANPPTPVPSSPRGKSGALGESVPEWLITDVANITSRMRALNPYLSTCPLSSAERSRYMRMLERYERDSTNVARDAADGSIDNYTIRELTSITNNGFEIVGDLELKCR